MVAKERVQAVLDRVRPFLQADGGDIELVSVEGNSAHIRLIGGCAACPSAHMTLHAADLPSVVHAIGGTTPVSLDDRLREVEADLIRWALEICGGNKSKAAELLRIKRSRLGDRINRCGLGGVRTDGAEADASLGVTT
jgi:Fe-S cluster biogenesis protein NfuA